LQSGKSISIIFISGLSPGLSKLANLLFTKELQKRLDVEDVHAVAIALHPGGVRTGEQICIQKAMITMANFMP
jgi:hypothetical protein